MSLELWRQAPLQNRTRKICLKCLVQYAIIFRVCDFVKVGVFRLGIIFVCAIFVCLWVMPINVENRTREIGLE